MAAIHVCPLAHVEGVLAASGARSAVSLLTRADPVDALAGLAEASRLHLTISDVTTRTENHILADAEHIATLLAFLRRWNRQAPLLIHCHAGVSRSTAAAFIALCLLDPDQAETVHARALRAASPTATPNPHLVALADAALGRAGRMTAAIAGIGRGADCFEGRCFALAVPEREGD